MKPSRYILFLTFLLFAGAFVESAAQSDASNNPMDIGRSRRERPDTPPSFQEMIAKRRAENEKREHEELLERGETALTIADDLEASFKENRPLTNAEIKKLAELEKLVTRIRKDLGGDDDEENTEEVAPAKSSTVKEAFSFLKDSTNKLVSELKRTTRFSISVVAIQTSNSVIRLARFLRFRK